MKIICITPIKHLDGAYEKLDSMCNLKYLPDINKDELKKILFEESFTYLFTNPNKQNFILDKEVLEIATTAQEETLNDVIELMEKAKTYSDCKNIILSGGYHLNCSNNFKLVKLFPEYNFFVDPICYDGGTAIGAALYYENYL